MILQSQLLAQFERFFRFIAGNFENKIAHYSSNPKEQGCPLISQNCQNFEIEDDASGQLVEENNFDQPFDKRLDLILNDIGLESEDGVVWEAKSIAQVARQGVDLRDIEQSQTASQLRIEYLLK